MMAGRSILIVEDNPMDLDLARRVFGICRPELAIDVARDGEEALNWLGRWERGEPHPNLILLDLHLPRINGLEVLRRLKAHNTYGQIPVVVVTTSTELSDVRSAYSGGANSYVVKPVDFDEFVRAAGRLSRYWLDLNQPPL